MDLTTNAKRTKTAKSACAKSTATSASASLKSTPGNTPADVKFSSPQTPRAPANVSSSSAIFSLLKILF